MGDFFSKKLHNTNNKDNTDNLNNYKLYNTNRIIFNKIFLNNSYGNIHMIVKNYLCDRKNDK